MRADTKTADRSVIDPDPSSLPSCSIAVKAEAPQRVVAAEEAASLDSICARRPATICGRGGRKPAARSNKRKGAGRNKEKKKGRGLDMPGAHISRRSWGRVPVSPRFYIDRSRTAIGCDRRYHGHANRIALTNSTS